MNPQDEQQNDPSKVPDSKQAQPGNSGLSGSVSDQDGDDRPQVVYMSRPLEPHRQTMSPEIQQKHEESKRRYPKLNLSQGEYIISAVKRHPIGLVGIWAAVAAVILALMALAAFFAYTSSNDTFGNTTVTPAILMIPVALISFLALVFGFIASWIYGANRFYLTNESVIQHIQTSLFSQREQTISLVNIEDASFSQDGIVSHIFNYGLIRLSTQGDETTYRFSLASSPQRQIALLNNAVEDFKNVRPMED